MVSQSKYKKTNMRVTTKRKRSSKDLQVRSLSDTDDASSKATNDGSSSEASQGKAPKKKRRIKIKLKRKKNTTPAMTDFFNQVDALQSDIEKLSVKSEKVDKLRERAIRATTTKEEHIISKELKSLTNKTSKQAKQTKDLLCLLEEETKTLKEKGKLNVGDERIRDNLCNMLTRKYCDEIDLYQAAQQEYKKATLNKIKRQVKIVKPDITDEEVDTVLKSPGGRDDLYKELVLAGGVAKEVK